MSSEPMTLYKLMILYLLKQVSMPLSEERFSEFFLSREYTTYFTIRQALEELEESGLIRRRTVRNTTRCTVTAEGEETIRLFSKKIPPDVLDDLDGFIKENRFRIRSEAGTTSDYYRNDDLDYIVRCEVTEGKTRLISLSLAVPDEAQASLMCSRWNEVSRDVYAYAMKRLLGG